MSVQLRQHPELLLTLLLSNYPSSSTHVMSVPVPFLASLSPMFGCNPYEDINDM